MIPHYLGETFVFGPLPAVVPAGKEWRLIAASATGGLSITIAGITIALPLQWSADVTLPAGTTLAGVAGVFAAWEVAV